jgi:pimeloyl-ACP methyl ester carboxylesterase
VASFAARPLWPGSDPGAIGSWHELAGDLGEELARREIEGAVGVGHSMGSVLILMNAARDPRRFRALAMIDPVIFSGLHMLYWGVLKGLGLGPRLPLIQGARRRRDSFPSLEAVREAFAGKSVFASWDPRVLEDYVDATFGKVEDGGVSLRYPKVWESRLFEVTPANVWPELRRIDVPVLVIRGAESDTFLAAAADRMSRTLPNARVIELPGCSHFVPMERPLEVANLIIGWVREIGDLT